MRTTLALLFAFATAALGQSMNITAPPGCSFNVPTVTVACGTPPPVQTCSPYGGIYPNCTCIPPQTGTPPNCSNPPPGAITCPGFTNTRILDLPFKNPAIGYSSNVGGFGANDMLIVRFTTGSTTSSGNLGSVSMAEYQGPPTQRVAKLSATPCDLTGAIASQTPVQYFSVGPNSVGAFAAAINTTYYFNAKNVNCAGVCNVIATLQAP